MGAAKKIWGFLVDRLFILKVHDIFFFFCIDRILEAVFDASSVSKADSTRLGLRHTAA